MTTIVIQLPDKLAQRLAELARRLNMSVEDLAATRLRDLIEGPDEPFRQALRYVLDKNAELYRRLA